jgi:hypothetical protein
MKSLLAVAAFVTVSSQLGVAFAQDLADDPGAAVAHRAPPASRGFQMALRTGFAIPFGNVEGGDGEMKMSDFVGGQVPLFIEIGGKPIKQLFIGGYLGFGVGSAGGDTKDLCDDLDMDCYGVSTRLGVEVQYHILPAEDINPWVGYGIGFEGLGVAVKDGDEDGNLSYGGFEFARLSAGLDFRISRVFGVGPFADFSLGSYGSYQIDAPQFPDSDGDVEKTAVHEWLTVGARFVFFP